MSFTSSWKKQSSRLKTGNMNIINNDSIYADNSTFNNIESKFASFYDISSSLSSFENVHSNNGNFNKAFINDIYITNLGQNNLSNDKWLNVDNNNKIYVVDLSSSHNNLSIGGHSLMNNKYAWGSTAIGYDTMQNISSRTDISFANTAIGSGSMKGNNLVNQITGIKNSAIGFNSLKNISSGSSNSAFGANSLLTNTTGSYNTANGESSLNLNTSGMYNSSIGARSLLTNSTGSYNAACGSGSMTMNISGSNNVACGHNSLSLNTSGCNNSAIGYNALFKNNDASCNTAVGSSSLFLNTNGINNVAIGSNTLYNDVSGSFNTVVGSNSDALNTSLSRNQIIGYNNKSEYDDVNIIGTNITSQAPNKTYIGNISDSSNSLTSNIIVYDPNTKEISYDSSLFHKTNYDMSGNKNIIIGDASINTTIASDLIINQSNNIFLSNDKSFSLCQYDSSNSYFGYGNIFNSGRAYFNIDNQGSTSVNGSGKFNVNTNNGLYVINLNANGPVYSNNRILTNSNPSDPSLKKNILSIKNDQTIYDNLLLLNPVKYQWNYGDDDGIKFGFLANEVHNLFPNIVSTFKDSSNNDKMGYDPVSLIPVLTTGILKNIDQISQLRKENIDLKNNIYNITQKLNNIENKIYNL